jgi:hypothetical protein
MVQVLQGRESRERRPSFAERLNVGLGRGLEMGSQIIKERNTKSALKKEGIDPDLPSEFQQMAYQAKLNKQLVNDERAYALKNAQNQSDIRTQPQEDDFPEEQEPSLRQSRKQPIRDRKNPELSTQKLPVKSPDQIKQEATELANRYRENNIPVSDQEIMQELDSENNRAISYNNNLDIQEQNTRNKQRDYGALGVDKISQLLPEASQQVRDIFQKRGEDLATSGKSEAEISSELSKEATKLKNNISNVSRSIGPRRTHSGIVKDLLGTSRSSIKQQDDMRLKLKPLTDQGLYDEARSLLSGLGYEPEERENLLSSLGEAAKTELAQFPELSREKHGIGKSVDFSKGYPSVKPQEFSPRDIEKINASVSNVLKKDPATNMILLRKAYEDKGVGWEEFKNALNDAILSQGITLNDDQLNALDILDQPPENLLDKILGKLGFSGR